MTNEGSFNIGAVLGFAASFVQMAGSRKMLAIPVGSPADSLSVTVINNVARMVTIVK